MPRFSKDRWPPSGDFRTLLEYLEVLHRAAGQPSFREIGNAVALSPNTISPFFTGARLINRGNLELLVEYLGGDTISAEALRKKAAVEWNDAQASAQNPPRQTIQREVDPLSPATSGRNGAAYTPVVVPKQLPNPPRWFVGRVDELDRLTQNLSIASDGRRGVALSAIVGVGGVGKTALALQWAHQNVSKFPEGQLYINLRAFDPSGAPLSAPAAQQYLLKALGVEPPAIPEDPDSRTGLYRSLVAGRRLLIIADNALDTKQIEPLIPGGPSCAMVITSRNRLPGLRLYGAEVFDLDVLGEGEALELYTKQVELGRSPSDSRAVAELVQSCGGLPLAIAIAAGFTLTHRSFPTSAVYDALREAPARLDALDVDDPYTSLRAVFSWSYSSLGTRVTDLFCLMGAAPGPDIGHEALTALTGDDFLRVKIPLKQLENASLIHAHQPQRFRMHDLVRLYSVECAGQDLANDRLVGSLRRLVDFYLHSAYSGDRLLAEYRRPIDLGAAEPGCRPLVFADDATAMAWFTAEHQNLLAAQQLAHERKWYGRVWQLSWTLDNFHWRRGYLSEDITCWRRGLQAGEATADQNVVALAYRRLGRSCGRAGMYEEALDYLSRAVELTTELGDMPGRAHTHRILAWLWKQLGEYDSAAEEARLSLDIYQGIGMHVWEAHALNEFGLCCANLGQYESATQSCARSLELHRKYRHMSGEAESLDSLGLIALAVGHDEEAIDHYARALVLYQASGNTYDEANVFEHLGHAYTSAGNPGSAKKAWLNSLRIHDSHHRIIDAERLRHLLSI